MTAQPRVYWCFTPGVRDNLKIVYYVSFNNNNKQRKEKEKNPTILFFMVWSQYKKRLWCYECILLFVYLTALRIVFIIAKNIIFGFNRHDSVTEVLLVAA